MKTIQTIDCLGQACPGPVIQAKRALEGVAAGDRFRVLVDSAASRDNVTRFARNRGCAVTVQEKEPGSWLITIAAPLEQGTGARADAVTSSKKIVLFITSEVLGRGDDQLGAILMEGFVRTLTEQNEPPDAICLMNAGVRLAVEGSPVAELLSELSDTGCEVLVCGTCLDFFDLKHRLAAGLVSNMFDIQERLLGAGTVIRP